MKRMLIISVVLFIPISGDADKNITDLVVRQDVTTTKNSYFLRDFSWIGNRIFEAFDSFISDDRSGRSNSVEGRKHKIKKIKLGKIILPIIVIILVIKALKLPLILKALAIKSGTAILLSVLSLILSAIIGLRQFGFGRFIAADSKVDMVTVPVKYKRREHMNQEEPIEEEPYRYYAEKRRRRRRR